MREQQKSSPDRLHTSMIDRIKKALHHEKSRTTQKPLNKEHGVEKKPSTQEGANVKKSLQKSTPKRPIERILTGSWNAIKYVPEKQEQWLFSTVYEKFIYPKLTREQKVQADILKPKIKQAAKVGGWVMTGGEVIIAGVIVKKLYGAIKNRRNRMTIPSVGSVPDATVARAVKQAEFALPDPVRNTLSALANEMKKMHKPNEMNQEEWQGFLKIVEHEFGQLLAHGMPDEVANMIDQMKKLQGDDRKKAGLQAIIQWVKAAHIDEEQPDIFRFISLMKVFRDIPDDFLLMLDKKKFPGTAKVAVLSQLDAVFSAWQMANMKVDTHVSDAVSLVKSALTHNFPEDFPQIEASKMKSFHENIIMIAESLYQFIVQQPEVVAEINALGRDEQIKRIGGVVQELVERGKQVAKQRDIGEDAVAGSLLSILMGGLFLEKLGFPGIEKIGIRLKPPK